MINVVIDTNPPRGGTMELTLVNRSFLFTIRHFTLSSLFATKLHACFFRKYVKGRDYYDLLWFLGKKTIPDFALLNRAVVQTEGVDLAIGEHNFDHFLQQKISTVNFDLVKTDVAPFIEDKGELKLLEKEIILKSAADIWEQGN